MAVACAASDTAISSAISSVWGCGMTASEKPQRTVQELLVQALESLPPDERQRVTAWVLSRSSSPTTSVGMPGRRQNEELLHVLAPNPESFRDLYGRSSGGSQQVVPVR